MRDWFPPPWRYFLGLILLNMSPHVTACPSKNSLWDGHRFIGRAVQKLPQVLPKDAELPYGLQLVDTPGMIDLPGNNQTSSKAGLRESFRLCFRGRPGGKDRRFGDVSSIQVHELGASRQEFLSSMKDTLRYLNGS